MERLPTELYHEILLHVPLQDLKSIRLASRLWAELGGPYLIPSKFLSLPNRDDFGRLFLLSRHPSFAHNIETLELNMGEMNEYYARHNAYFVQNMRDPEERDHDSHGAWMEYAEFKSQKESLAHKYCNPEILEETFKNLPNLRAIDVKLTSCPFQQPLLNRIWQIPSTRLLARVSTTERFSNIISAARHLNLDSLTHDCLPFEFWSQRNIHKIVTQTFKGLRTLKIYLDYSVFPNALHSSKSFSGFGSALCAAPNLETLHMGFANSIRPQMNLAECMGDYTWCNLRTLGLEGMTISEDDVVNFLMRHAATLKRLQLGVYRSPSTTPGTVNMENVITFQEGTFRGLLTRTREAMKLEKLNMKGDVMDIFSPVRYNYGPGLYDDDWIRVPDAVHTAARALAAEQFMMEGTEWDDAAIGLIMINRPVVMENATLHEP